MPSSNFSIFSVTSLARRFTLLRIHRSAPVRFSGSTVSGTLAASRFMRINREAFHTLLAKFRLDSTRSQ